MKLFKYFTLFILLGCLMVIGYLQYSYVLNFTNEEVGFFIKRVSFVGVKYDIKFLMSGKDPRAYSMLFYSVVSMFFTVSFIGVYFKDNKWSRVTIVLYSLGYALSAFIYFMSSLVSSEAGLDIFQKVKNALSSSYIIFFLVPLFIYFEKEKRSS